ncbi:DUF1573 domain-containing protein [Malonomonas rubra]|uniref:DUF1573 domain-containing protein n=1 Tax=Malonomonas rubra TaxID=57040 RepID=UPI0026EFDA9F|nr:DUF1573 domain-containing protein [Malonomonas rubra]
MFRLLILLLLFGYSSLAWAAPQLVIEKSDYNFGDLMQGEKVEYVFRFRNAGDEVLQVSNVRTSCGCTAALLSATRIAPGDMGELRTTFDSGRFKGTIHKTITMETNDPLHPRVSFGLTGNVKVELLSEPDRISWGQVKADEPLIAKVILKNLGKNSINLLGTSATTTSLSGTLSGSVLMPGKEVELKIEGSFPEGKKRLSGYVIIATDYPKAPQIRIPVSARLGK